MVDFELLHEHIWHLTYGALCCLSVLHFLHASKHSPPGFSCLFEYTFIKLSVQTVLVFMGLSSYKPPQCFFFSFTLQMEVAFFDVSRTGEITSRLSSDTSTVSDQVSGMSFWSFLILAVCYGPAFSS